MVSSNSAIKDRLSFNQGEPAIFFILFPCMVLLTIYLMSLSLVFFHQTNQRSNSSKHQPL
ncbi:hypothetical protein HanIR_Chr01g0028501 [Helianthus annuus]|nr:hypothetical protein HanIR_Chr01g0028501 [Helianthus annuus]